MNATLDRAKDVGKDLGEVWNAALTILKERMPEPSYRTWLDGARLSEIQGRDPSAAVAVVAVPSAFAAEWLQRRYARIITDALTIHLGYLVGVSFKVEPSRSHRAIRALDGLPSPAQGASIEAHRLPMAAGESHLLPSPSGVAHTRNGNTHHHTLHEGVSPGPLQGRRRAPGADRTPIPALNPRYTFDRFLVGRSNQLGASLARRVAEDPGAIYNPLFIYGFHGVGKTHLLHAIGHDAHSRSRSRVLCVPATLFDNHAVASRLVGTNALNHVDLLLVDDLHNIAGARGRAAQRWLVTLVEGMLAAGKGVVVTAAQPPDSMLALNNALQSRLREGTVVALELPDAEMRLRMANRLAQQLDAVVAHDALELLASRGKTMLQLRSLLEQAIAGWNREATQIDVDEDERAVTVQGVQAVLAQVRPETGARFQIGPERIIDQVASYFDLETNEMCS